MPTIVGKEAPSVTLYYYKGNAFTYVFTVEGPGAPGSASAKIVRVSDPDEIALVQFNDGLGLSIVGQEITLSKTSDEMLLPPGTYKFIMEGTVAGEHKPLVQRSLFIVNDAIGQQLPAPAFIVATAVSDTQIDVNWDFAAGASVYILRRSLDALTWATVYTGANAFYGDSGLTASTLYYYLVIATAPGKNDSNPIITNATTLATDPGTGGDGGGVSLPPGGVTGDFLVKASDTDGDAEWVSFEEVPHDHNDLYYTKTEIDALGLGSGTVFTGTI